MAATEISPAERALFVLPDVFFINLLCFNGWWPTPLLWLARWLCHGSLSPHCPSEPPGNIWALYLAIVAGSVQSLFVAHSNFSHIQQLLMWWCLPSLACFWVISCWHKEAFRADRWSTSTSSCSVSLAARAQPSSFWDTSSTCILHVTSYWSVVVDKKIVDLCRCQHRGEEQPITPVTLAKRWSGRNTNPSVSVLVFETMHLCTSSVLPEFLLMVLLLVLKWNDIRRPFPEQTFYSGGASERFLFLSLTVG